VDPLDGPQEHLEGAAGFAVDVGVAAEARSVLGAVLALAGGCAVTDRAGRHTANQHLSPCR